jgi:tetratricopeptide (TPR) repeat protein
LAKVQESGHKSVSVQDLYESGFALRCSGDYQQARDVLGRVLESDPQHLEARWQLALIDGFEGEFERSLEGLKTLAEEAPANLEIRYDYAMTLMMLGFAEESCVEFRAILEINPEHEKAKQQIIYCE